MPTWDDTWPEYPRVVRQIGRRIRRSLWPHEDPEDVVMDAVVGLLASGQVPGPGLLLLAARRQLINHYRRRSSVRRGGAVRILPLD